MQILEIPTKLFYQTRLTSKAKFPPDGPKDFPHIGFFGISGQELQDEDSPSYYNNDEASKIIELVSHHEHSQDFGLRFLAIILCVQVCCAGKILEAIPPIMKNTP